MLHFMKITVTHDCFLGGISSPPSVIVDYPRKNI